MATLSTGSNKRLTVAALIAALLAIPAMATPQDITTLLAIFLRNLHGGRIVIPVQTTFAALPTIQNGVIVYCSDCTEGADPATGGSTGAFVLRVNGRWVALDGGSGSGGNLTAEYWIGAADGTLVNAKNLGALSTALVVNTAGVPSAYAGVSCTNQLIRALSAVGAVTCATVSLTADVTGTLPIANGGTNGTTKTAAFNNLADGSANGDLMVFDGTNWVKFARGERGTFLRTNDFLTPSYDWVPSPNFEDQPADVANSSNVTYSELTDLAFFPTADTWIMLSCRLWYQSAATTTGITVGLWANNIGATSAPQFISARVRIGGVATEGTDAERVGYIQAHAGAVTSTDTFAATTYYMIDIDANILTHATEASFLLFPRVRSEANTSAITIKEGSQCSVVKGHADS